MANSKYVPYVGFNTANANYQPPAYQAQRRAESQTPPQRQIYYPERNYVAGPTYANQPAYLNNYSPENTRHINNSSNIHNQFENRVEPLAIRDEPVKSRGYREPELGKFKEPLSRRDRIE